MSTYYSSIQSLKDAIGEAPLINYVNDESLLEDEIDLEDEDDLCNKRINEVIKKVYDEINSYIDNRYTLPFSSIPERLLPISDDICVYYLVKRRNRTNMPEDVVKDYQKRIKDLEKIAKGTIDLGITDQPSNMASEMKTNKTSSDKIFNNDVWKKF
jgi:phage gp36-like protein